MKKILLVAAAALGLGGCATYGSPYGSGVGVSVGYGGYGNTGYGGGYGYNQGYNNRCVAYDRYGRAYNACGGYGGSYGSYGGNYGAYGYPQSTVILSYPGYTYNNGYYYDRRGRRYDGRTMNRRYGRNKVYRRGY